LKKRGIGQNELPPNLIDRSLYFMYNVALIEVDYSEKATIDRVHSLLIGLKDEWLTRSEENNINEDEWDEEIECIYYALGMCTIFEFFKLKDTSLPKSIFEITVPKNFNSNAYIKAINSIFLDSNDDLSKNNFLDIISERNISKEKLLNILTTYNFDSFIEDRKSFIKKVDSRILPKPEIKFIYTNSNLTANMANINIEKLKVQGKPKVSSSSSSSSKRNDDHTDNNDDFNSNLQKLLSIAEYEPNNFMDTNNNNDDDYDHGDNDDNEEKERDDDDFINTSKSKIKETKITNKKSSSSSSSLPKNKLIGKVLVDKTASQKYQSSQSTAPPPKSKQQSTNDVIISNLSQIRSKMSTYDGKDPLNDITNMKRPSGSISSSNPVSNINNKSDKNGEKSKGVNSNNRANYKKPKLTDTRPNATKVVFDDIESDNDDDNEDEDEDDDDDDKSNHKEKSAKVSKRVGNDDEMRQKYGISKFALNFLASAPSNNKSPRQSKTINSSDLPLPSKLGSSKFPNSLRETAPVSPRSNIQNKISKEKEKNQTTNRKMWTFDEEEAFKAGMKKHGIGHWQAILNDKQFGGILCERTGVNLKDKYKNMRNKNPSLY